MKLEEFDYELPKELIAQEPKEPRDHSRLLVLDKKTGVIEDRTFYEIVKYFKKGDMLVLNNSKVFPARLKGERAGSGGKIEIFLLHETDNGAWLCLVGGRRVKTGLKIVFKEGLEAEIIRNNGDSTFSVGFNKSGGELMRAVSAIGETPLPPYIKREKSRAKDRNLYQTVYADDKKVGSAAAPTAGFHFTNELLKKLKVKGVQFEYVTLHVGLGTFAPVKTDNILQHKMHSELIEIDKTTVEHIKIAKREGRRIIAVGTTSVRTLESFFFSPKSYKLTANRYSGWTDIFIYPGYEFKIADAMITNFHLPKSTLLMLVSAFAGKNNIGQAYQHAIKNGYRFFSYGDAMFIK